MFSKPKNKAFLEKYYQWIKIKESLGLGKKSSGAEADTETWSWFRLPIPKPGFGRTLLYTMIITNSNFFSHFFIDGYTVSDVVMYWREEPVVGVDKAELPQFTIVGWETNERKIKLATGIWTLDNV